MCEPPTALLRVSLTHSAAAIGILLGGPQCVFVSVCPGGALCVCVCVQVCIQAILRLAQTTRDECVTAVCIFCVRRACDCCVHLLCVLVKSKTSLKLSEKQNPCPSHPCHPPKYDIYAHTALKEQTSRERSSIALLLSCVPPDDAELCSDMAQY